MKSISAIRDGIKFWKRERDPLVEQTLSFMQGIVAELPSEKVEPADITETIALPRIDSDFMVQERAEHHRRVIRFQTEQRRIRQDREQHYNAVWEKTRATLGNLSGEPML